MTEEEKDKMIATFRFGVIADLVTGVKFSFGERQKLIQQKCSRIYSIPFSQRTRIPRSTLLSWIHSYKRAGFRIEGLYPKTRSDKGQYKRLTPPLRMAIKEIKSQKPCLKGPALIKELRHQRYLQWDETLNLSCLYRFLKNENLQTLNQEAIDRRLFEAEFPNQIWQADVMHGPSALIGGKSKKTYLMALIDDHSRLIVHAEFYSAETLENFKKCFKRALETRGLPSKLYIDNGSCFRAVNLEHITASLGIALTHSRPYTPQGRGKIERWFRFVQDNFLPSYRGPQPLEKLNEELENWIYDYHNRVHGSTRETPFERYRKNLQCVRPAPQDLLNHFRKVEVRTVKKDRTVRLDGLIYEVPVHLIDRQVELRFHPENLDEVEVFFSSLSYGLAIRVNPVLNSQIGRNFKSSRVLEKPREILTSDSSITPRELFCSINSEVSS